MKQGLKLWGSVLFLFFWGTVLQAQDTLPNFSVENKGGGRMVVSWTNPYPQLIQLAVQRSYDSLKRFGTVYSTTSPELPINGFSDKVPEGVTVYYRIFYVMDGGAYFFSPSRRPGATDAMGVTVSDDRREILDEDLQSLVNITSQKQLASEMTDPDKPIYYTIGDEPDYKSILTKDFRAFRDSIISQTKDTLIQAGEDTLFVKLYNPPFIQKTSEYVYTNADGYVEIKLNDVNRNKYQLIIMDEDEATVLEFKQITEPLLIVDKTNFYKAGWYKFTLKENGRIKEKGKVFLPRDFNP